MFPRLPARATFVADSKNVSDFVQKHFESATNVSQFAQPKKHHGQQCVRNKVSSFARAFTDCHAALFILDLRIKKYISEQPQFLVSAKQCYDIDRFHVTSSRLKSKNKEPTNFLS